MCVRYAVASGPSAIEKEFRAEFSFGYKPCYNACPGYDLPVITADDPRKIQLMRWGLIPHWAKNLLSSSLNINALSREIVKNPVYRTPIRQKRCLVVANCYFVWIRLGKAQKIPHVVYQGGQRILSFAGIWDEWISPEKNAAIRSFSIITTVAGKRLQKYQPIMPVIVSPGRRSKYLDRGRHLNEIMQVLQPTDTEKLNLYPVSFAVNDPQRNNKDVIMPTGPRLYAEYEYVTRNPWNSMSTYSKRMTRR